MNESVIWLGGRASTLSMVLSCQTAITISYGF